MGTELIIALIASFTAIITSIFSTFISLRTARRTQTLEKNKLLIELLEKKQSSLEKAKQEIISYSNNKEQVEINIENMVAVALNNFRSSRQLLSKFGHHLEHEVFINLSNESEEIQSSYTKLLAENYMKKRISEETKRQIDLPKMANFGFKIEKAITDQLLEVNQRLEKLLS